MGLDQEITKEFCHFGQKGRENSWEHRENPDDKRGMPHRHCIFLLEFVDVRAS